MTQKRFGDYAKPSVAVDVVCLTAGARGLSVLLYEREAAPQSGSYALPGGFVQIDESLDEAAERLLRDKAGLTRIFIDQLYTFGQPKRDPRGRVITVAYYALIDTAPFEKAKAQKLMVSVPWSGTEGGPVHVLDGEGERVKLYLDHATIIGHAVKRLRRDIDHSPLGFELLPEHFTLRALQDIHEAVLGETQNKDSFRRRMLATGWLDATGAREQAAHHRPAEHYRFRRPS